MIAAEAVTAAAIGLRPARVGDLPFVFNSWLESYKAYPLALGVPKAKYFADQHALITELLRRGECLMAVNPADDTHLLGYVVHEPARRVVHYVYVKHPLRREGIARHLLSAIHAEGCTYTHHTPAGAQIAFRLKAHFNPGALP